MAIVNFDRAVALLRDGAAVAIPTETVYGLAGRIDNAAALGAIFTTKRRPFFDPLIVHVAKPSDARSLTTEWTPLHDALAREWWPGPLTFILPKAEFVSSLITSGLDTVGVRCPAHPLATRVLEAVGVPLAAPSANMFGRTSPTSAAHVEQEFGGTVAVLDGGSCEVGVESTVLSIDADGLNILRPGSITAAQLRASLRRAGSDLKVSLQSSHRSPGHLEAHYQPANPVVRITRQMSPEELSAHAFRLAGTRKFRWLKLPAEAGLAARGLYSELRRLSQSPAVIGYDERYFSALADGEAILDRLRRASTASWT